MSFLLSSINLVLEFRNVQFTISIVIKHVKYFIIVLLLYSTDLKNVHASVYKFFFVHKVVLVRV